MKIHQVLTGLILVIVLSAFGMIKSSGQTGSTAVDPTSGYFKDYHDPHYNFVVVKVTKEISPEKIIGENMKYEGEVLADMRSTIKIGSQITIIGDPAAGGSLGAYHGVVETGRTEVFLLESTDQKDQFAIDTRFPSPFGLDPDLPIIPASDVPLIAASLKELNTALKAPDALGPPRDHASALLKDKNPYLWALGCWELIQGANRQDIQLLKDQFSFRREMTPGQALFLSNLFDFPENTDGVQPSQEERYQLLRGFLTSYVRREIIGPQKPASTQQGLFPEEPEN